MNFDEQLDTFLRARFPLILVVTQEEERCLQIIKNLGERTQRTLFTWDFSDGFKVLAGSRTTAPDARDPLTALEQVEALASPNSIFILKDFHEAWDNPQVKRKLRSVSQRVRMGNKSIIVTSPNAKIPDELRDEIVLLELELPKAAEMEEVLLSQIQKPGVKVNLTPLGQEKMVQELNAWNKVKHTESRCEV